MMCKTAAKVKKKPCGGLIVKNCVLRFLDVSHWTHQALFPYFCAEKRLLWKN